MKTGKEEHAMSTRMFSYCTSKKAQFDVRVCYKIKDLLFSLESGCILSQLDSNIGSLLVKKLSP